MVVLLILAIAARSSIVRPSHPCRRSAIATGSSTLLFGNGASTSIAPEVARFTDTNARPAGVASSINHHTRWSLMYWITSPLSRADKRASQFAAIDRPVPDPQGTWYVNDAISQTVPLLVQSVFTSGCVAS